ncbi:zinc finger BED domain-containing protein RICESLEEPER 2-like [Senna tora]|uniref:Zinc finger BED domain-containing protein RICESLEEPER 2-like n=1 Tax=Senna tora TaxID=362788 RepID=A0A834TGX5_9FABA|nr:zinc finger BED domain-containing protein RICESLEEPER 2-like [Senna tora]
MHTRRFSTGITSEGIFHLRFTSPSSRAASSHADGRHARLYLTQTRTASDFSSPSVHRSRLQAHRHTHSRQSVSRTRTTGNGQRHRPLFSSSISLAQWDFNSGTSYSKVSRNTAVADIWKFYLDQKELLKQSMSRTAGRICLTADCWTSYNVEGYICLTTHFVDENWKLNSKILSFCKMEPPHTGIELANKVFECLKEWGIDRKVFSLTLDNASANDNMQDILKEQLCLQNSLLCNGDFFHVRCCAHILNLIVQEAVLDPRMKLEVLCFSFKKLDVDTFEEKMDFIKSKLYDLYAQYESNNNAFGGGQEYINYISEDNCSAGKSELDTYLEEAKIDPKYSKEMDVLGNWKQHRHRFPILSRMACDILSIPITSVASESAFSIGSRVLNKYRCSLLPDNVQALICTRNWLHGFQIDDDDKGALGDDEASNIVQNIYGSKLSTNAAT